MLDLNFIRANPDQGKKAAKDKGLDLKPVDEVLAQDKKRRELLQKIETLRAERNQLTRSDLVKGKKIKVELKKLEPELKEVEAKLNAAMLLIPNPAAADVKTGRDERDNEMIRKWGQIPKFDFPVKDHLELGEKLGTIDVTRAG